MRTQMLPSAYQRIIHLSRYSRWRNKEGRRETWEETVDRYFSFFAAHLSENHNFKFDEEELHSLKQEMLSLNVMPSMRALMSAGPALEYCHVPGYNCSFTAIDSPRDFSEILYILCCGTGVGFSVEQSSISKMPPVASTLVKSQNPIEVADSRLGWAEALRVFVSGLYAGEIRPLDVSKVRPAGAKLHSMGGRASGSGPLLELATFFAEKFEGAKGRRLSSIEIHDLVCKIADVVVMGGVRRSALISLSDLQDHDMRAAKSGNWLMDEPQRANSNNSAIYNSKPSVGLFMEEFLSLYNSKSGERGIFNREGVVKHMQSLGRRDSDHDWGTNPCAEISLRSKQFCNLSEVVVRADDDRVSLERKVRAATILGTMQSTLTRFRFLGAKWQHNSEEERLLGVSLTGICDNAYMSSPSNAGLPLRLRTLRDVAIETNRIWADKLGINPSTAITALKPSGTVSALVNSSSGIHPRYAKRYIRRIRMDVKDPMTKFMMDRGFPHEMDFTKGNQIVFSFPMRASNYKKMSATQHLELVRIYQANYCEHKVSGTISVEEHEWPEVQSWIWKNFDSMSGISFLPTIGGHGYKQMPFEEVDSQELRDLESKMPKSVSWNELAQYENEDHTTPNAEPACSGDGVCSLS